MRDNPLQIRRVVTNGSISLRLSRCPWSVRTASSSPRHPSGDTGCSRISATVNNAAGNTGTCITTNKRFQTGRTEKDESHMVSLRCGKGERKQTHRSREQKGGDQRGQGWAAGAESERGRVQGDGAGLGFGWGAPGGADGGQIVTLHTWNLYDVINQCYID